MTVAEQNETPPAPNPDHHRLTRWLHEWKLYLALQAEDVIDHPDHPPLALDTYETEDAIAPRDIRLIHPSLEPTAPRYVAVLQGWNDRWRVIPFGQLGEPAVRDEIRTDRAAPALRVLCPWNTFIMTTAMLRCCWRVDRLTDAEVAWMASPPTARMGPPLRHPFDPRWDYLEMESQFRQRVCNSSREHIQYDIRSGAELPMAAEDRAPYGNATPKTDDTESDNT